ncbi:MAG: hypothetical protein OXT07_09375 [bacterium]|nr:hypothetical protein [bacterium]
MPASEQKRLALRNRLIEVLGEEEAEVLMESLPPFDWHRLATKDDIFVLKDDVEALKKDVEALKGDVGALKKDVEALKGDVEASEQRLRTEMNAGFTNIRTEMDGKFAKIDAEFTRFRGEMALQLAKQTRTMVFTMLGLSLPTWGAILAVGLG